MITIVNLRPLQSVKPLADVYAAKIMVTSRGKKPFGLTVDSAANDMDSEMQEVIDTPGADDSEQALSVSEI